jgi:hypothetical protein
MRTLRKHSPQPEQNKITTLYLIGDDSASKTSFYACFDLVQPEESQELTITVKQIAKGEYLEIYDFPTDKLLR